MNLVATPGNPLVGSVALPGDKSLSHRAALFAALAEGTSTIDNFLDSGVTRAMLGCLRALGVDWSLEGSTLVVHGRGWRDLAAPDKALDCGNSATTLRLLTGALSAAGVPAVLDGSPGLRQRPMARILEPLVRMGAPVSGSSGGRPPLTLLARPLDQPLQAAEIFLPVASAQVKSCLLLAALSATGPVVVHEPGLSRDHSERMLAHMGVKIMSTHSASPPGSTVRIVPPEGPLRPLEMRLPGDFSAAAFLIVAALITPGSQIELREAGLNPTRTGLLEVLSEMGADLQVTVDEHRSGEPCGKITARHSRLHCGEVSGERVARMIDEFPIFAIAACHAEGLSQVRQAAELRVKESDRIACLHQELQALGANMAVFKDGFDIRGGASLTGGIVSSHADHRLAMSLAVAGLASRKPVRVKSGEISNESFPDFITVLSRLGADIRLEG